MKEAKIQTHEVKKGECLQLSGYDNGVRILFVCAGEICWDGVSLTERTICVPQPGKAFSATATEDAKVLEILRWVTEEEFAQSLTEDYPFVLPYDKAETYTEECKSPKTVSRMLVPARLVPRFAMGSVQTKGEDLVAPHRHPDVEQYFYSLAENDCILLIDDAQHPFAGNQLLHIPLGSNHGIKLEEQHTCHYLWIDFLLNEKGLEYIESSHKPV